MELLESYSKINTALFAVQMEINSIHDSEKATILNRALFCVQVEITKLFNAFTSKEEQFRRTASEPAFDELATIDTTQSSKSVLEIPDKESDKMPKIINGQLHFTRAEIRKMPLPFRKEFYTQGGAAPVRRRSDLRYNCSFEIRYRKGGWSISGSGETILEAVDHFILNVIKSVNNAPAADTSVPQVVKTEPQAIPAVAASASGVPTTLTEFMNYYFDKYRSRKVAPKTLENDRYRVKNHILPYFKSIPIADITSDMVQEFIDERTDNASVKTAKEVNSLLSGMFAFAIEKKLIDRNPCKLVVVESYESEHGVALTEEEENYLIGSLKDNPKYLIPIAVAMYAGLRPCEYRTATIEGDFIKAQNCKQKTKKPVYKYIPIIPRLKAILNGVTEIYFPNRKYISAKLKAACPEHKLYDLRTTFDSRCEYYKVSDFARKTWMGHGLEKLRKTYGSLPNEWFLKEAKLLDY